MERWFVIFKHPPGIFCCELRDEPRDDAELDFARSSCFSSLLHMANRKSEVPQSPPSTFVEWHLDHFPRTDGERAVRAALAYRDSIPNASLPWSLSELQAAVRAIQKL